jgi:hypothetical protein
MRPRQRSAVGRDQAVSPFAAILMRLCHGTGAVGAALVDFEGETVDYAGRIDPFEIRVAAAEWRLVLRVLSQSPIASWADTHELVVRASQRSFVAILLDSGYAVVAQLPVRCFALSPRALAECVRDLCREAGFEPPQGARFGGRWSSVDVRTSPFDRRRPSAVWHNGSWHELEILGRYAKAELGRGEMGYRARLPNGAEITLVRERLGRWYAEDLPEAGA